MITNNRLCAWLVALVLAVPAVAAAQQQVQPLPQVGTPADAESNTQTQLPRVGAWSYLFNGTTWDRWRGDTTNGAWVNVKTGSVTVTQGTGTNLHMVCDSGCSSSSAPADEATFTFGTTSQTPIGGVFQTTATNNALTTGQMGAFQVTANRALFVNFRNAAGTEIGTASNPVQVSLANTGANGTAVSVTANAGTNLNTSALALETGGNLAAAAGGIGAAADAAAGDATGSVTAHTRQIAKLFANVTFGDVNNVASATGLLNALSIGRYDSTQPTLTTGRWDAFQLSSRGELFIAKGVSGFSIDNTTFAATQSGSWSLAENQSMNVAQLAGTTTDTNSGNKSAGTLRVVLATDQPALTNKLLVTPDANSAVNVAQINGVTVLMGNGATGTGSQRVTIASDNTAFSVNAQPTPVTSGGLSTSATQSAASTNSTSVKGSAGQIYHVSAINTTATLYYLRLYNSSSAPTCSSATGFIETIPIPASTTGSGLERELSLGAAYGTGIGFCITGGGSSTDNTNAATGVYVSIYYK